MVFLAAFVVVTLGMPLGATKLYLFGISVDQQFRTEYLTRLTDSPALHDMTYAGLPPFYPPGWFWIGGRAAALTGTPAWEMFKPWAITSITIAVVLALVLWSAMIRFEYALVVTAATAAVMLAYASPEPYSAMITVLLPPVLVLAWSGLRAGGPGISARLVPVSATNRAEITTAGWAAVLGVGRLPRRHRHLLHPAARVVGADRHGDGACVLARQPPPRSTRCCGWPSSPSSRSLIALITWLPFLLRALRDPMSRHRQRPALPARRRRELTFPMLQFSLLGALCMLGTLWLIVRARSSVRAGALAIGVLTVYLWSLLSMLTTLARHHPAVLPAAADADGAARRRGGVRVPRSHPGRRRPRPVEPHPAPGRRGHRPGRRRSPSARTSPTCCAPT